MWHGLSCGFSMESRWLRILVFVVSAVWLGLIIPSHQRGAIPLKRDAVAKAEDAIDVPACHRKAKRSSQPSAPAPVPRSGNCAICFFAASLTPPPPPIDLPALTATASADPIPYPPVVFRHLVRTYDSTGPPLA